MVSGDLPQTLPLSVLIDGIAHEGDLRDEDFVRRFSMWMHDTVAFLRLHPVENLDLIDVVLTFEMKQNVRLIITGRMADGSPGEVTVKVLERDFPHVMVDLVSEAHPLPYDVCTLDYSYADRRVRITGGERAGQEGNVVVVATVGTLQQNRLRLDTGDVITVDGSLLEWVDVPSQS
jgi:hypothetical protein